MVVVPPEWRGGGFTQTLERAHTTGYQLVVEPLWFNGNFHLHFYPTLERRLRDFDPHVVHIDEEPYNLATFHALWQARRVGARVLWFTWQNLRRRYPLPFRWIEAYNLRHADYAIAGSEGAASVWRQKGYRGPLAVIPQFGVDPDVFLPRPARRDVGRSFRVGYVGRLVAEKGVDLLVEAMAAVEGSWELVIAGQGPEEPRLRTLTRTLGVADHVFFAGHIPSLRMPAFYRELDVLVLPSRSQPNWVEQFGRVLPEAMACGVPVLGSDCGEIPAVIDDAGLIFPEDDVDALRTHLLRLMRDPALWADLARRGRARVLAHFTQASVAARTVDVYRELSD
jgi:glycosyltransferase involved in cell wall biosynthesis